MLVRYFLNYFEMAPFAAVVTGMSFVFACRVRYIYVVRSWYLKIFRFFFFVTFLGAFANLRKTTVNFVVYVCPHGTTRFPLVGF